MVHDLIDSFIEAKSSLELPKDPETKEELFNVLAHQVKTQWEDFVQFSAEKETLLTLDSEKSAFDQRINQVQETCAETIKYLDFVPQSQFQDSDLFHAKEMALQLTGAIEAFKEYYD